uniref:Uncharacterized protein n=1 Tax=Laticauda laticaudata TaxID=8630 RepID=A0A8C5RH00_LATLA
MRGGARRTGLGPMADDGRDYDLTEAQQRVKAKYPAIQKKYECESCPGFVHIIVSNLSYNHFVGTIRKNISLHTYFFAKDLHISLSCFIV